MYRTMIATPLTQVDTSQVYPLGTLFAEEDPRTNYKDNGPRVWMYVKNGEATDAFAAGELIQRKAGDNTKTGVRADGGTLLGPFGYLGVAQHAIAAGSYGWILKRGYGTLGAGSTAITVDQQIIASAGTASAKGRMKSTSTATTAGFGWAVDTIAIDGSGVGYIDIPG